MKSNLYHDLAAAGARIPIGTDLVLHEKSDPQAILQDGSRLGAVVAEAARRYRTPLAIPLMDLTIENHCIFELLDLPVDSHLVCLLGADQFGRCLDQLAGAPFGRWKAHVDGIRYVATQPDLVAVGMSIGPFSLVTKLIPDPITAVYLAGAGASAADDSEVARLEQALELGLHMILRSITTQIEAGAKAIIICEPAANQVYFSPNQLAAGADVFERYVMQPNRRLKQLLAEAGVDLILHNCGELTDEMVRHLATLEPVVLSLGSSRRLWEDARLISKNIVLYGNLPTKKFYSDELMAVSKVAKQTRELLTRMRAVGHPFILGSECDVLSVSGHQAEIQEKVATFLTCEVASTRLVTRLPPNALTAIGIRCQVG